MEHGRSWLILELPNSRIDFGKFFYGNFNCIMIEVSIDLEFSLSIAESISIVISQSYLFNHCEKKKFVSLC